MSTDDVFQPASGPTLDEYGVPVEQPRPGNRLVAYGPLAGFAVLPIAAALVAVRYVPPHHSNQVTLGTWLLDSSPSGHLIVGSGWPRLVALAGALIFLLSLIVQFLRRKQRRIHPPAKLTGTKFLLILPVAVLGPLLIMSYFFAGIILLAGLILPHGMPVTHCNSCGAGG